MTLFVVLLPLLNFLLMLTFSRLVHWKQLASLVIFSMCVTLTYLITRFGALISGEVTVASIGNWVHSGLFEVNWNFSIDTLTYTMLIVVLTVSTLVHLYSTEYMSEDPHISRFISYLSLFTFFMLLLITSDNFVNLFLGWEGVGLCSYLLISFWFTRIQANKAAIKAMVVNRIADLAFTIGMLALFYTFQTSEFNLVFGLTPYMVDTTILFGGGQLSPLTLTATLLFLGAMGKSAQIGLHTWLPDAMEGWLPVGPSIKKILPYAGTTSLDTLVSSLLLQEQTEKSKVEEVNPQETGVPLPGSSETLRKTASPRDFTAFLANVNFPAKPLTSDLEWVIGFSEGNGSFIVDKTGYVSFQITRSVRDVQVLFRVRQLLGFGSVSQQDAQNNTWRFRVRDKANLRKIILLFNGNLVLEKNYSRFFSFVSAFNLRYTENTAVTSITRVPTLADGWLSGFTDAEGCFTVSVLDRPERSKKPYQVQARFILAQKGAKEELTALSLLLDGRVAFQKSYSGHNLSVQLTHLKPTLRYFRLFPLKTIKRVALIKFLAVYATLIKSILQKRVLTPEELLVIRRKAKEINKTEQLVDDKVRPTK